MPQRSIARRLASILLPMLILPVVGCSGPKICHVTGTVQLAGKPVANLVVNFVPEEGRPSYGMTDDQGAYHLKYDRTTDGAVRGTHKVFFKYRPHDPKQEIAIQQGTMQLPSDVKSILEKYGSAETTTLRFEVKEDGQVIDITLD
jgi:hypothetical protein